MSFNIKNGDGSVGTINIGNVVMQLNNISDTLNGIGTGGGSISEVQITNLNNRIKTVSDSLQAFIIDSEKYIDETELSTKLQSIVNKLNNLVETNTFTTELNRMNTGISTINSEISNIKRDITTLTGLDLSEYQKKSTLETDVKAIITPQLTTLESNVKTSVETSVNSSISGTLSSLETVIDTKNQETLDLVNQSITLNLQGLNDTIRDINSSLSNYVLKSKYDIDMKDVVRNWGEPSFNSLSVSGETRLSGTTEIVTLNVENLSIRNASHTSKFVSMPNFSSLELGNSWYPLNLLGTGTLKYNNEEVALQKNIPVLTETEKLVKNDTNNNFTGENNFTNLKVNNNPVMNFKTVFEGKELIFYEKPGESGTVSQSYAMFVGAKEYNFVAITLERLNTDSVGFDYGIMEHGSTPYSKTFIIPKGKSHIEIIRYNYLDSYIKINDNSQEITIAFMDYDNTNPFCLTEVSIF